MRLFNKYISILFILSFCFGSFLLARTQEEEDFFSYKRLFLDNFMIDKASNNGLVQQEIVSFVINYNRGIEAIGNEDFEFAERSLKKARKAWPEYFQTDFLLALVYEKTGNYSTAARYYKSYLNKLKDFEDNKYRISEPLIKSFMMHLPPSYNSAQSVIAARMKEVGIDMNKVKPVYNMPVFLLPGLMFGFVIVVYLYFMRNILPYIKKQERIKNPPEGFWVCKHCGKENPILRKECEDCGKAQEETKHG